ncbi:hypothetical protein MHYP_G00262610 [Metynnis hypsauchen]
MLILAARPLQRPPLDSDPDRLRPQREPRGCCSALKHVWVKEFQAPPSSDPQAGGAAARPGETRGGSSVYTRGEWRRDAVWTGVLRAALLLSLLSSGIRDVEGQEPVDLNALEHIVKVINVQVEPMMNPLTLTLILHYFCAVPVKTHLDRHLDQRLDQFI